MKKKSSEINIKTVHTVVTDKLRELILSGNVEPGRKLGIKQMAEIYNVSQMPVRQAFQSLESEGLLERIPYQGAKVLQLDLKYICDIYDLRLGLELLMFRLSLKNINENDLKKLKRINAEFSLAITNNNLTDAIKLNLEFHDIFNRKSNNTEAIKVYKKYNNLIVLLKKHYTIRQNRFTESVEQHNTIIKCLENKEKEKLYQILIKHGDDAKNSIIEDINKLRQEK